MDIDPVERYRKLAVKRGLTPGTLLESSPVDFDVLLLSMRREFPAACSCTEREVNELLHLWLQSAGGMLAVDHVELRRWLVDLKIVSRDAYGHAYVLASLPARLAKLAEGLEDVDFRHEFTLANDQELQKRAARKAAWQQAGKVL